MMKNVIYGLYGMHGALDLDALGGETNMMMMMMIMLMMVMRYFNDDDDDEVCHLWALWDAWRPCS